MILPLSPNYMERIEEAQTVEREDGLALVCPDCGRAMKMTAYVCLREGKPSAGLYFSCLCSVGTWRLDDDGRLSSLVHKEDLASPSSE